MFLFSTEQIPILFDQTNEIKDWSFNSNVSTNREYRAYQRKKSRQSECPTIWVFKYLQNYTCSHPEKAFKWWHQFVSQNSLTFISLVQINLNWDSLYQKGIKHNTSTSFLIWGYINNVCSTENFALRININIIYGFLKISV